MIHMSHMANRINKLLSTIFNSDTKEWLNCYFLWIPYDDEFRKSILKCRLISLLSMLVATVIIGALFWIYRYTALSSIVYYIFVPIVFILIITFIFYRIKGAVLSANSEINRHKNMKKRNK
jgi:hypothetical protein